jgi:cystathionine beta-lyase/cystathionine gamma-synthase
VKTKEMRGKGLQTRSIHAGMRSDPATGAVKPPLVMSNNYEMPIQEGSPLPTVWESAEYVYVRDGSPNGRLLEERLANLEGAPACVVTSSGVSAVCGAFLALVNSGDHVVASNVVYGSVYTMLSDTFPRRFGIAASLVDTSNPENVRAALTPRTRLIHIETPGNPNTRISDIAAIAKIAREAGALLSVDSTWSGLTTQHPLSLGADLVMHSLTKYINGHGDAAGGAVLGTRELIDVIRRFAVKDLGGCISPFNAWQILRGLETLPLRMERHNRSALKVARFLERDTRVAWVRYPGLASHPEHRIARRQMNGFSGMLAFDIRGDPSRRAALLQRLEFITHATCLGHDESLIAVYCDPEDRGQARPYFRVSIGLEDVEDLIADLNQALSVVQE